jgi:hypothetical protein
MRTLRLAGLTAVLLVPTAAVAGNRVYLVPAIAECPGPATCERTFESTYTFDTIALQSPGKYLQPDKASIVLDVRGVRDASGALVNGTINVRILSGRVSIPAFGTFPDNSPVTITAPQPVTLKNGKGHLSYKAPATPAGLIQNGGGVEVLDPTGKRLAVTGAQAKP